MTNECGCPYGACICDSQEGTPKMNKKEIEQEILKTIREAGGSIDSSDLWAKMGPITVGRTRDIDNAIKRLKNAKIIHRPNPGRMVWAIRNDVARFDPPKAQCQCETLRSLLREALPWMKSGNDLLRKDDIDGECAEADEVIKRIEEALAS